MEFKDQYKHPNWQKKRLECLEKAEFMCERCYDSETQLHVHHKRYIKGRKIWDYPLDEFSALCEQCHDVAHDEKNDIQNIFAKLHPESGNEILSVIAGFCHNVSGPCHVDLSESDVMFKVWPRGFEMGRLAAVAQRMKESDIRMFISLIEERIEK